MKSSEETSINTKFVNNTPREKSNWNLKINKRIKNVVRTKLLLVTDNEIKAFKRKSVTRINSFTCEELCTQFNDKFVIKFKQTDSPRKSFVTRNVAIREDFLNLNQDRDKSLYYEQSSILIAQRKTVYDLKKISVAHKKLKNSNSNIITEPSKDEDNVNVNIMNDSRLSENGIISKRKNPKRIHIGSFLTESEKNIVKIQTGFDFLQKLNTNVNDRRNSSSKEGLNKAPNHYDEDLFDMLECKGINYNDKIRKSNKKMMSDSKLNFDLQINPIMKEISSGASSESVSSTYKDLLKQDYLINNDIETEMIQKKRSQFNSTKQLKLDFKCFNRLLKRDSIKEVIKEQCEKTEAGEFESPRDPNSNSIQKSILLEIPNSPGNEMSKQLFSSGNPRKKTYSSINLTYKSSSNFCYASNRRSISSSNGTSNRSKTFIFDPSPHHDSFINFDQMGSGGFSCEKRIVGQLSSAASGLIFKNVLYDPDQGNQKRVTRFSLLNNTKKTMNEEKEFQANNSSMISNLLLNNSQKDEDGDKDYDFESLIPKSKTSSKSAMLQKSFNRIKIEETDNNNANKHRSNLNAGEYNNKSIHCHCQNEIKFSSCKSLKPSNDSKLIIFNQSNSDMRFNITTEWADFSEASPIKNVNYHKNKNDMSVLSLLNTPEKSVKEYIVDLSTQEYLKDRSIFAKNSVIGQITTRVECTHSIISDNSLELSLTEK